MSNTVAVFAQQLSTLATGLQAERVRNSEALSRADRAVSHLYHQIETQNFSAVTGYLLARQLKEALMQRRRIKVEAEILHMLSHHLVTASKRLEQRIRVCAT